MHCKKYDNTGIYLRSKGILSMLTRLIGLVEECLSEYPVVNLHSGHSSRCPVAITSHHNGMCGSDLGLALPNIKWNRVHKGFMIYFVVVNSPLVPDFIGGFVVDVHKVPFRI